MYKTRQSFYCFLLSLLFFMFLTSGGVAQTKPQNGRTITGIVVDAGNGDALPGVTVLVEGLNNGGITDADGKFSIDVPQSSSVLTFSYVGYEMQKVTLHGQNDIKVSLSSAAQGLNELVVIGYGVQKKVDVVGSISQISNKAVVNVPEANLANILTGTMTGVANTQTNGEPGTNNNTIRIRGIGSFGADPSPLVIVDGIPRTLNEINPNDVETISVLKDASTAAIYGARAANGVILVTTKKGAQGKTRISYDGYFGVQKPTTLPNMVNSWEYKTAWDIASNIDPATDQTIALYKAGNDPDYPNTNFLKDYFTSGNGLQTAHNISATGGNDIVNYFTSFGYLDQKGIVMKDNYNRYNLRFNANAKLYKNLTLSVNLSGSNENKTAPMEVGQQGGDYSYLGSDALTTPPIYVGQYPDGTFGVGPAASGTIISDINSDSKQTNINNKFNSNARLDWNVTKDLTLSAIGGYDFRTEDVLFYWASIYLNPNDFLPNSSLKQNRNEYTYKTGQLLANYSKKFGNNNLGVLLGYSFEDQQNAYLYGFRNNFVSNIYNELSMGSTGNQQNSGYSEEWALLSYFGRINYSFKDRYLLEGTLRSDGSSRFPQNKRFATFPSIAAGWRVSEEPFFQSLTNVVSNLKLKVSYGVLGNQNIGLYPYQQTLGTSGIPGGGGYVFGSSVQTSAAPTTYVDPDLHWESTRNVDGGLELSLWKGIINLEATYFARKTSDILETPTAGTSKVLGMSPSQMNIGTCENNGLEFEVTHQKTFKNFNYKVTGQLTVVNNKITYMGVGASPQASGIIGSGGNYVGYPMQAFYGYLADGVFLTNDEIAAWPNQTYVTPQPQPGDIRYKDINGTDPTTKLPTGQPDQIVNAADQTYLGSQLPKYYYSGTLELGYRDFDFQMLVQGVGDVSGMLSSNAGWAFTSNGNIQRWQYDGSWTFNQTERNPAYPRLQIGSTGNYVTSSYWIRNAAYCRIKRAQVGYSLPKKLLSSAKISNLRIYFSGDNLLTFSKYPQGWDPEQTNLTGGSFYPIVSTYTLGLNIDF